MPSVGAGVARSSRGARLTRVRRRRGRRRRAARRARVRRRARLEALDRAWPVIQGVAAGSLIPAGPPGGRRDPEGGARRAAGRGRRRSMPSRRGPRSRTSRGRCRSSGRDISIVATMIAPGRTTTAEEVATLVAFLCSRAGHYYSGCRFSLGAVTDRAKVVEVEHETGYGRARSWPLLPRSLARRVASGQPNLRVPARAAGTRGSRSATCGELLMKLVAALGCDAHGATTRHRGALRRPRSGHAGARRRPPVLRVAGERPSAVLAWFQGHVPAGSSLTGRALAAAPVISSARSGTRSRHHGVLVSRDSVSMAAARGGGTAVRIDAQDIYWVPRPRWERVPAGVQQIDVTVQRLKTADEHHVADGHRRGAGAPDRLARERAAAGAAVVSSCPVDLGPTVTLTFLQTAAARRSRRAVADGSGCGDVSFTLHAVRPRAERRRRARHTARAAARLQRLAVRYSPDATIWALPPTSIHSSCSAVPVTFA